MIKNFDDFVNENLTSLVDRYKNQHGVRKEDLTEFKKWLFDARPPEIKIGAYTVLSYNFGAYDEYEPGKYFTMEELLDFEETLPDGYRVAPFSMYRSFSTMNTWDTMRGDKDHFYGTLSVRDVHNRVHFPKSGYYSDTGDEFVKDNCSHYFTTKMFNLDPKHIQFHVDMKWKGKGEINCSEYSYNKVHKDRCPIKIIKVNPNKDDKEV